MSFGRPWTDFTYLFRVKKQNTWPGPEITQPNAAAVERRRKLEDLQMQREYRRMTAEVWE